MLAMLVVRVVLYSVLTSIVAGVLVAGLIVFAAVGPLDLGKSPTKAVEPAIMLIHDELVFCYRTPVRPENNGVLRLYSDAFGESIGSIWRGPVDGEGYLWWAEYGDDEDQQEWFNTEADALGWLWDNYKAEDKEDDGNYRRVRGSYSPNLRPKRGHPKPPVLARY